MLTGFSMDDVVTVIADATDLESLSIMASKCRVLISCVGPFRFFGEAVLRACLAHGTHYIGAGGEGQYLMNSHLKFDKEAQRQGIYIIDACGAASVLADCGTAFLQRNFNGTLNDVEIVTEIQPLNRETRKFNYASYISYANILANQREWKSLEKDYLHGYPNTWDFPVSSTVLHYNRFLGCWCILNPQCDSIVVKKSQLLMIMTNPPNAHPIQVRSYFRCPNLWAALFQMGWFVFMYGMANFAPTKWLIEKFPSFFTMGMCNPNIPLNRKSLANTGCVLHIFGSGWTSIGVGSHPGKFKKPMTVGKVEVKCQNPVYGTSGKILFEAAWTILFERQNMPERGGVYTPSFAFKDTTLINRLCDRGVSFKFMEYPQIKT